MTEDMLGADICRVCRSEGLADRPLFHPCICTGSIKWIHQECLVQWMRYSRKEYCELCGHRFSFTPIYSPDMPRRLPLRDVIGGLFSSILTAVKYWLHYTLVAIAWLGVVPLTAYRTYRALFSGPLDLVRVSGKYLALVAATAAAFGSNDKLIDNFVFADNVVTDGYALHGKYLFRCISWLFCSHLHPICVYRSCMVERTDPTCGRSRLARERQRTDTTGRQSTGGGGERTAAATSSRGARYATASSRQQQCPTFRR